MLVGADGKFEADPDTVLVQFNISAQNETLQAASDRAKQAAEQVRDLLRKNGLDPKLAQIGQFVVSPVYDYKSPKRKLVGYRVNSSISIKFKDFAKVGPLTNDLFNLDVTDSQSVSYILEDMDAAKVKAVQDAMRQDAAVGQRRCRVQRLIPWAACPTPRLTFPSRARLFGHDDESCADERPRSHRLLRPRNLRRRRLLSQPT